MAQVPPPPPPYMPPGPRPLYWQSPGLVAGLVVAIVVVISAAIFMMVGIGGPFAFSGFFLPVCGILIIIVLVAVIAVSQGFARQRIPPPPPIQQPMVPAGAQGAIALNCPNCGAPPQNVDRFGVATCTYCGTRFLVR